MEEIKKIKICKVCGLSDEVTKFQKKLTCIKCNSLKNNMKYGKEYFVNYSKSHYVPTGTPRGRPKRLEVAA
jgi:hypothetical protein